VSGWNRPVGTAGLKANCVTPWQSLNGTDYRTPTLSLPSAVLEPGYYRVQVALTNFLGSSSTSPAVVISVTGDAIPSLVIEGMSPRPVYRAGTTSIFAKVRRPCVVCLQQE
jgi:hypothetical protein